MNNKASYMKRAVDLMVHVGMRAFPPFDMFYINYFARRRGNSILKLNPTSFSDYCKATGGRMTIIEDAQERPVYQPEYYPEGQAKEYAFRSPSIYLSELEDVTVHGGSGLVITGDRALTDISANDIEGRVLYRSGPIVRGNKKTFYLEVSSDTKRLDTAINLCGIAASNYFHLTFEILSRYEYVKQYMEDKEIPVLLDEDARKFPQYVELINTVLKDSNVVYVPLHGSVRCKKLIHPSMNTWMPMNVRKKNDFRTADNLVARSAIENIRKAATEYIRPNGARKIFISRKKASFSRIVNEAEVARLFNDNGYEIVCTEDLTYRQQVELFSSAACIVGASGAALTNVVYCNPGAVFGCVIPKKYNFCIYSSIAHMVGLKELFLDAKVLRSFRPISTERCIVNMKECRQYVSRLEALIKQ